MTRDTARPYRCERERYSGLISSEHQAQFVGIGVPEYRSDALSARQGVKRVADVHPEASIFQFPTPVKYPCVMKEVSAAGIGLGISHVTAALLATTY
jgi:hypothetical protein